MGTPTASCGSTRWWGGRRCGCTSRPRVLTLLGGAPARAGAAAPGQRRAAAPGEWVGLWGIGGLGGQAVQVARLAGAGQVIAVDPNAKARERSLAAGNDVALDPTAGDGRRGVAADWRPRPRGRPRRCVPRGGCALPRPQRAGAHGGALAGAGAARARRPLRLPVAEPARAPRLRQGRPRRRGRAGRSRAPRPVAVGERAGRLGRPWPPGSSGCAPRSGTRCASSSPSDRRLLSR